MHFEGISIGGLQMFGWGLNWYILDDILHMCLQIPWKETKEKINFDELPKMNSRIKIIKIKNMRLGTKVLKWTF